MFYIEKLTNPECDPKLMWWLPVHRSPVRSDNGSVIQFASFEAAYRRKWELERLASPRTSYNVHRIPPFLILFPVEEA